MNVIAIYYLKSLSDLTAPVDLGMGNVDTQVSGSDSRASESRSRESL